MMQHDLQISQLLTCISFVQCSWFRLLAGAGANDENSPLFMPSFLQLLSMQLEMPHSLLSQPGRACLGVQHASPSEGEMLTLRAVIDHQGGSCNVATKTATRRPLQRSDHITAQLKLTYFFRKNVTPYLVAGDLIKHSRCCCGSGMVLCAYPDVHRHRCRRLH